MRFFESLCSPQIQILAIYLQSPFRSNGMKLRALKDIITILTDEI